MRLWPKANTMNHRSPGTTSCISRQKTSIVNNRHLQWVLLRSANIDDRNKFLTHVAPIYGAVQTSFLRPYKRICYITCIIHVWQTSGWKMCAGQHTKEYYCLYMVNVVYTIVRECRERAWNNTIDKYRRLLQLFLASGLLEALPMDS